jgi:hypothetical protein
MNITWFAALLAGACTFATAAMAEPPAAIVEEVAGNSAGVEFMDYLEAGRTIRLGPQDRIVLSYLKSCTREAVTGGTIKVGAEQSEVQSGQVERTRVDCDARRMLLAAPHPNDSAGLVVRGPPKPQFTLFGSSPVVEVKGSGTLAVTRLDKAGEQYALPIAQSAPDRRSFVDFAANGMSLAPGGLYRAVWGAHQVVFKVDATAKPGRTPVIGRLLKLDPET